MYRALLKVAITVGWHECTSALQRHTDQMSSRIRMHLRLLHHTAGATCRSGSASCSMEANRPREGAGSIWWARPCTESKESVAAADAAVSSEENKTNVRGGVVNRPSAVSLQACNSACTSASQGGAITLHTAHVTELARAGHQHSYGPDTNSRWTAQPSHACLLLTAGSCSNATWLRGQTLTS